MNALKLVQTIRARHSFDHIAVIILTTLKSYKQSLMYRHLGSPYVVKPYGVTDFAKAIAETLENLPELKIKFTGP
jgi:DNA-binding response OmpR family regulator